MSGWATTPVALVLLSKNRITLAESISYMNVISVDTTPLCSMCGIVWWHLLIIYLLMFDNSSGTISPIMLKLIDGNNNGFSKSYSCLNIT